MSAFISGPGPRVREMLATKPAAVLIPSYRTDWLPEADHKFINERYIPLADDFWLLGADLPPSGGEFEIIRPGRYRITSVQGGAGEPPPYTSIANCSKAESVESFSGKLDGTPLTSEIVELKAGRHCLRPASEQRTQVIWLGPRLTELPQLPEANHKNLFVNWY